ncbi:MAG: hypothetical protein AAF183_08790 [Pseudomonadota bacterium]
MSKFEKDIDRNKRALNEAFQAVVRKYPPLGRAEALVEKAKRESFDIVTVLVGDGHDRKLVAGVEGGLAHLEDCFETLIAQHALAKAQWGAWDAAFNALDAANEQILALKRKDAAKNAKAIERLESKAEGTAKSLRKARMAYQKAADGLKACLKHVTAANKALGKAQDRAIKAMNALEKAGSGR